MGRGICSVSFHLSALTRRGPEEILAKLRDLSLSEKERLSDMLFPNLAGVIDNCSSVAPKAAHVAMSLLSLCVAHRPVEVLYRIDADPLSKALYRSVRQQNI